MDSEKLAKIFIGGWVVWALICVGAAITGLCVAGHYIIKFW